MPAIGTRLGLAVTGDGLIALARCPANRVVDKPDGAVNPGLKSPDLNSSLGRLRRREEIRIAAGFCNLEETQDRGAIVISSGAALD
jgi:hypothetical protein